MIVEMRVYTLQPGKVREFVALYEAEGLAIVRPILGNLIGYYTTEIGNINQVVQFWGYASFDDRARRRSNLNGDKAWLAVAARLIPLIHAMENRILTPTAFSPCLTASAGS